MKQLLALCLFVGAVSFCAYATELRSSGKCSVKEQKSMFDRESIFVVKLQNEEIQAQCKIHSGKFVDEYALSAVPWITNLGGKKLEVSYHAAFFDSKGELVASISQNASIPTDASGYQLASSIARLPKATIENIKSYKIVIYASESNEK